MRCSAGCPTYLDALDLGATLAQSIERHILAPDGLLRQEPRFLLAQHSDLREDGIYFSALRAIAAGRTRRNEIATRVGRSDSATGQLLDKLYGDGPRSASFIPVTVANPDRTKVVRFALQDPFLRFWFACSPVTRARCIGGRKPDNHLVGLGDAEPRAVPLAAGVRAGMPGLVAGASRRGERGLVVGQRQGGNRSRFSQRPA